MPKRVQEVIGVVGPKTRGVEKMLRAIGLTYAHRIDPFDGGPHFSAKTDEVTLVRATRRARVVAGAPDDRRSALVCGERGRAPHFVASLAKVGGSGAEVVLPEATARALGVGLGDEVGVVLF